MSVLEIQVVRRWLLDGCTLGELYVDGRAFGFACEDEVRSVKIAGETAIPAGEYAIRIERSPSWKRDMPYLADVPGFTRVMIHPGNSPEDTRGCILVGCQVDVERGHILQSRACFDALWPRIKAAAQVKLTVVEEPLVDRRSSHV